MGNRKSILIVGAGSIGERHVRCFAATNRAELSICEVNPPQRETIAARYRIPHTFDDLAQALDTRPDAVVVCTPAHLHIPVSIAAARARAHLLIEKPLSTNLESVDTLLHEPAVEGLVVAVAYVFRAHPALSNMREAIRSGCFGEPLQIVATCGQHFPHYREGYAKTYYKDRSTGGGAVQDALTHVINAGEWLVGPVNRLIADLDHQMLPGVTVEDTVHVLTRHGKIMGSFSLNQHQAPNECTITVICRSGTVRFEYHNNQWRWMTHPEGKWCEEAVPLPNRDALFIRQAEAFLDATEGLNQPLCTLNEALQTLRVNVAILKSAEEGAWESVHLKEVAYE